MDQFMQNQDLDFVCKRTKDSLAKMAQRQGQEAWFASVVHDDSRLQRAIKAFNVRNRNKARGNFPIAQYKETFETYSEVLVDEVGEMMTEDEWVEYSSKRTVDRLSITDAQLSWKGMKEKLQNHYHDHKGHKGDKPELMIRIKIKDVVTFRSGYRKTRMVEFLQLPKKN